MNHNGFQAPNWTPRSDRAPIKLEDRAPFSNYSIEPSIHYWANQNPPSFSSQVKAGHQAASGYPSSSYHPDSQAGRFVSERSPSERRQEVKFDDAVHQQKAAGVQKIEHTDEKQGLKSGRSYCTNRLFEKDVKSDAMTSKEFSKGQNDPVQLVRSTEITGDVLDDRMSDGFESMDDSGGESCSESEGEERFEKALQYWRRKVRGGSSKGSLLCAVCTKYSNTRQVYQGFRALVQHAETHTKLKPSQHRAYGAALQEVNAEGGREIVPASKKLRLLEPHEKVWPPILVVENLRTGIKEGKWEGIDERDLKDALQKDWPIKKVTPKWRWDGHTGVALLHFEDSSYGYDRAREMHECWSAKRQGREDWERVRPPRKGHGESVQQEHGTWQRYRQRLVEEDGSPKLFAYLATVADMERLDGKEKGKKWQTISAEEIERKRQREKTRLLESDLQHAKTRLDNEALRKTNQELQTRVEEKEVEMQAIRMERAHLNEQHEQWLHERLASIERTHKEEKLAAQRKADAEKQALERQLAELSQRRREDHVAMVAIKRDAETRGRQLRQVFETGLKEIDREYNEKEKASISRAEEQLTEERERLQREKEEATRSLLAEQAEKMEAIERERARAQEMMEEARKLRDDYLARKKDEEEDDNQDECSICMEPWSDTKRRAVFAGVPSSPCGHAMYCKACADAYLARQEKPGDPKKKRKQAQEYKCPVGCTLKSNETLELFL